MSLYLPYDWPAEVFPPGSEDFESSAVAFPVKFICSADPVFVGAVLYVPASRRKVF
jgi:hypothetical protein